MSSLDQLLATTREDVARRRAEVSGDELRSRLGTRTGSRPFKEALARPGVSLIAEVKRGSPSAGEIRPGAEVPEIVAAYEEGGAAALSVLTEPHHFGGSLDDLREARRGHRLPILRKDFIVDPYQLWESAVAGADADAADRRRARRSRAATRSMRRPCALDLDCVVEVHDEHDLERALEVDPDVIGINNRDLGTFETDLETTHRAVHRYSRRARPSSPSRATRVASSSMSSSGSGSTPC